VPIFKNDEEKAAVLAAAQELKAQLLRAKIRVVLDEREGQSPGWKFNDWEMRGVPVRVELGPKDVAKQAAVLARRDRPGREGKISASLADLPVTIEKLLVEIQQALHDKALSFRRANTQTTATYDEFKKAVETGFAFAGWCGSGDCEAKVKEETRATMRCIPLDQDAVLGRELQRVMAGVCTAGGPPASVPFLGGRTRNTEETSWAACSGNSNIPLVAKRRESLRGRIGPILRTGMIRPRGLSSMDRLRLAPGSKRFSPGRRCSR